LYLYFAMEDQFIFWVVLVIVLFIVYILSRDTLVVSDDFRILQTKISDFHFLLLKERCPIVIEDGVSDVHLLLGSCFSYMYMWWSDLSSTALWKKSMSKYIVVHNSNKTEDTSVWLAHPKESSSGTWKSSSCAYLVDLDIASHEKRKYVEIVLHPLQSVIIPCHWMWRTPDKDSVSELEINDIIYWMTACVSRVM